MNLVKFKIRLKNLNERLLMLQLPELCVDMEADTMQAAEAMSRKPKRRRGVNKGTRIRLALVEMRGTLEAAAQLVKELEEGKETA